MNINYSDRGVQDHYVFRAWRTIMLLQITIETNMVRQQKHSRDCGEALQKS